ncbi:MAG: hypothetical protein SVY10_12770 [Thermodesulfobacteriota bacterium]|nr:hypothetical protein [Thermodesulfobacteriota bacterium]
MPLHLSLASRLRKRAISGWAQARKSEVPTVPHFLQTGITNKSWINCFDRSSPHKKPQKLSRIQFKITSIFHNTSRRRLLLIFVLVLFNLNLLSWAAQAEIIRFKDTHPDGKVIEYWRLTHDSAIRDHANYHNTDCWSQDGRYICYTHYPKRRNEIHIVDLKTGKDILADSGKTPRWAKKHNWLFYARRNRNAGDPWERGTEVMRYEVDSGRKELVSWGMEFLGSTDREDRWIYGNKRLGFLKGKKWFTARAVIAPMSEPEIIYKNTQAKRPLCNPAYDMLSIRAEDAYNDFGASRIWLDLDGSNERIGASMVHNVHFSWSGDGEYQLIGNYQARGRFWNEPFPSNIHLLANVHFGDISPCGKNGRWICGDYGVADLRSGEGRRLPRVPSSMSFPIKAGDRSHLYDSDPKGSPDGTKICFVSNFNIAKHPFTRIIKTITDQKSLMVESTIGFPDSGLLEIHEEVVGYESKTATSFERISRHLYKTGRYDFLKKGWYVVPFQSRLLHEEARKRARSPKKWLLSAVNEDHNNPLLWQRQTDVYISVIRLPDPPHLRMQNNKVELIPGENHWETAGYYLERNGIRLNKEPLRPGMNFALERVGVYQAIAVEWSGLRGKPSKPIQLVSPAMLTILRKTPADFSWTSHTWLVNGKQTSKAEALKSDRSIKETHHIHDGLIRREFLVHGLISVSEDLAADGTVIRKLSYKNGILFSREYFSGDGKPVSLEKFAADGLKTEEICWSVRFKNRDGTPRILHHWFYENGFPVKHIANGGKEMYKKQGRYWMKAH